MARPLANDGPFPSKSVWHAAQQAALNRQRPQVFAFSLAALAEVTDSTASPTAIASWGRKFIAWQNTGSVSGGTNLVGEIVRLLFGGGGVLLVTATTGFPTFPKVAKARLSPLVDSAGRMPVMMDPTLARSAA